MKHLFLSLLLALSLLSGALAQVSTADGARSDAIQLKMKRVALLTQILPVALTKEQLNKLLPLIEKNRAEQKRILADEDKELAKLEPKLDEALKNGLEKGIYPPREMLEEENKLVNALLLRRRIARDVMTDEFYKKAIEVFDKGQQTIMAKSLDPKAMGLPDADKMDDVAKARYFIGAVFLDPAAYELLVSLSR